MSDLIIYHQSLTKLKRKDKSEYNYAEIKLIQGFLNSLAVKMEKILVYLEII